MYSKIYKDFLALPGYVGKKSESEKFAGADVTYTYETLMPEGKALQSCTSHDLGQNFSKAFDIKFQDKDGETKYAWQTSWGLSTRSIGGLLMAHGDDNGLILPPRVAPIQVVIIPVGDEPEILSSANKLSDLLRVDAIRAKVDTRDDESLGFKINKWELRGVPLRIELGPKERQTGSVTVVRRDTLEKLEVPISEVSKEIPKLLDNIQENLYNRALKFLEENTREATSYEKFKEIMTGPRGFIRAFWCENEECEAEIKEETKASTRCLPLDAEEEEGTCVHCGNKATHKWLFAQAY